MTKKALSLTEFLELTQEQQFDLLYKEGVYIGKRKLEAQTLLLFQLYSFYVEVYYRMYRKIVNNIVTSEHTDILTPYLQQIHVRDLKENNSGQ